MADANWLMLVVTAGAIGAGVSSVITALSAYVATRKQMEIKKMEVAVKLFEGKQAQVQFAAAGNPDTAVDLNDPAYSFLDYMKAVDEIQKKRALKKWSSREDWVQLNKG